MDADKKKRLKDEYRKILPVGAVYALVCSGNNHRIVRSTTDIQGIKNRIHFSELTGGCPDPSMLTDWNKYGKDSVSLVVLEEMQMKEDQSEKDFAEDIKLLQKLFEEQEKE